MEREREREWREHEREERHEHGRGRYLRAMMKERSTDCRVPREAMQD